MSEREQWLRINHFYQDNAGVKHRTWLTINFQEPHLSKGWPKDGAIFIAIGEDRDLKASFKLSPNECTRMGSVFHILIEDHERKLAALYSNRKQQKESDRNEDTPQPSKNDIATTDMTEEQKLVVDYKTGPLTQLILRECDVEGGHDKKTLLQRLLLHGYKREKIEAIMDLLIKDGLLVTKRDHFIANV